MNFILFDYNREAFLPLTYTRPVAELRIGINTIKEKWEYYFDAVSVKTEDYLSEKFPVRIEIRRRIEKIAPITIPNTALPIPCFSLLFLISLIPRIPNINANGAKTNNIDTSPR